MKNKVKSWIKKILSYEPNNVFIQIPRGLIKIAHELSNDLRSYGITSFISAEPCFGACDIRDYEAKKLGCDILVHFGHSDMGLNTIVPIIYIEYDMRQDVLSILNDNIKKISEFDKIGIVTTLQYIWCLNDVKNELSKEKTVIIAKGKCKYSGQILGCDLSAAKSIENDVDCFLFIGAGKFHALGLCLSVQKPVFSMDLEKMDIINFETLKHEYEKRIWLNIAKALDADNFGVIISTKSGQLNKENAKFAVNELEKLGKNAFLLVTDRIDLDEICAFADAFINTACPRIGIDDIHKFKKPIINFKDLEKLLNLINKT